MVLYFGDPAGALALLDRGVRLAGVVHGRRGGPGWRSLLPRLGDTPRWLRPDLGAPALLDDLQATGPRLIVSAFYPRRIPAPVLGLAPGINVHPSDLPRWRGPDPAFWAIRSGDATTALCVHELVEALDAGDVLLRHPLPIDPWESAGHLAERLEALGAELVAQVAVRLLAGDPLPRIAQQGTPSWAPLVAPEGLEIDWHAEASEVDRLVRAAAPHPGAFTAIDGEPLVVYSGRPVGAGPFEVLPAAIPFVWGGIAHVRCGRGAYRLGRVRLGRARLGGRALARLLV